MCKVSANRHWTAFTEHYHRQFSYILFPSSKKRKTDFCGSSDYFTHKQPSSPHSLTRVTLIKYNFYKIKYKYSYFRSYGISDVWDSTINLRSNYLTTISCFWNVSFHSEAYIKLAVSSYSAITVGFGLLYQMHSMHSTIT